MKIKILTVGTRGDLQPFVALGKKLVENGHKVAICTGKSFKNFVESNGVAFFPVRLDYTELIQSNEGQKMMGSNPIEIARTIKTLIYPMMEEMLIDLWEASKDAEVLIYHPKAFGGYDIAEKLGIPVFIAHPIPIVAPTSLFTNPALSFSLNVGLLNKLSFKVNRLFVASFLKIINKWRREVLGLSTKRSIFTNHLKLNGKHIPILYGCSPSVIPYDNSWNKKVSMSGFWFLEEDKNWKPSNELINFLEDGSPPIAINFGSIPLKKPYKIKEMLLEALIKTGTRGILISSWNGIDRCDSNPCIFTVDSIPHSWLFPKCLGVLHHGGAGTTAAALKAGKPMIICPFSGDQPFWARRMKEIGVATSSLKERDMSVVAFTSRINELISNNALSNNAARIAIDINKEKGVENTIEFIEERIKSTYK